MLGRLDGPPRLGKGASSTAASASKAPQSPDTTAGGAAAAKSPKSASSSSSETTGAAGVGAPPKAAVGSRSDDGDVGSLMVADENPPKASSGDGGALLCEKAPKFESACAVLFKSNGVATAGAEPTDPGTEPKGSSAETGADWTLDTTDKGSTTEVGGTAALVSNAPIEVD